MREHPWYDELVISPLTLSAFIVVADWASLALDSRGAVTMDLSLKLFSNVPGHARFVGTKSRLTDVSETGAELP